MYQQQQNQIIGYHQPIQDYGIAEPKHLHIKNLYQCFTSTLVHPHGKLIHLFTKNGGLLASQSINHDSVYPNQSLIFLEAQHECKHAEATQSSAACGFFAALTEARSLLAYFSANDIPSLLDGNKDTPTKTKYKNNSAAVACGICVHHTSE
jgi:hypothetical protein